MARRASVNPIVERACTEGSYEFLCGRCKKSAFFSDDLRVLQVPDILHPTP